jgi:phage terminase small subunit
MVSVHQPKLAGNSRSRYHVGVADDDDKELQPLDERERRFVQEYLLDPNTRRAAIAAGYSESTACTKAHQWASESNPTKPWVVRELARQQARLARKHELTAERILEELKLIGFFDIGDVMRTDPETGKLYVRDLNELTPRERRAIGELTQTTTERVEQGKDGEPATVIEKIHLSVKPHAKIQALRMLMDHLGMDAPKRNEHTGKDGGPIETQLSGLPAKELLELYAKARKDAEDGE